MKNKYNVVNYIGYLSILSYVLHRSEQIHTPLQLRDNKDTGVIEKTQYQIYSSIYIK